MVSFVVQNACFSLNTRFWQYFILIQQASALPRICTRVCAGLVVIVSLRTALGSLKEDKQFAWATISVYHFRNVCQLR